MAASVQELHIRVTGDGRVLVTEGKRMEKAVREVRGEVERLDPATRRLNQKLGRTAVQARKVEAGFAGAHRQLFQYGAQALSIHSLVQGLRALVAATIRQEQALAQVGARIAATGGAAERSSTALARQAAELQRATTFGDEEILEAQALLLSFRNIAGEAFDGATEAALDLSIGLKQDLRSAVIQLGKALDDPARGLDALSRSGTTFTDAQKAAIREMVKMGNVAGAQALILKEIQAQYGGAAQAARETLGGALQALGNTLGDLLELQDRHTEGWRAWLEDVNTAIADVDTDKLHDGMAAAGKAGLALAAVLAGKLALAVGRYGAGVAWASVQSAGLSKAALAKAASIDRATVALYAGRVAAHRYSRAIRGASRAVRGLGRGLKLLAGPFGLALGAVAYGLHEYASASERARKSQAELLGSLGGTAGRLEELRQKWDSLTAAQQHNERNQQAGVVAAAERAAQESDAALAEERARRERIAQGAAGGVDGLLLPAVTRQHERDTSAQGRAELVALHAQRDADRKRLEEERQFLAQIEAGLGSPSDALPGGSGGGAAASDSDYAKVAASLRTELQKLNDEYSRKADVVRAAAGITEEQRIADLAALELERRRERARLDGTAALRGARAATQALAEATDFSREAIERRSRAADRELELQRTYPAASEGVRAALRKELELRDRLLEAQSRRGALVARFGAGREQDARHAQDLLELEQLNQLGQIEDYEAAKTALMLEHEQARQERLLEAKRAAWELELQEAQGWRDRDAEAVSAHQGLLAEAEAAHQHRLIDERTKHIPQAEGALKALADFEHKTGLARVQSGLDVAKKSFGILAQHSRKAFALQQGAAVAQATIATFQGIAESWKKGLPLGLIEAAIVGAAGFAQVASIRAQKPPTGFRQGGVVDSPAFFSYAGERRLGYAGEAGPEIVAPAVRTRDGSLGFKVVGAEAGRTSNITLAPVVQVTVAGGADDGAALGEEVAAQVVALAQATIAEEQRPGGLLNAL